MPESLSYGVWVLCSRSLHLKAHGRATPLSTARSQTPGLSIPCVHSAGLRSQPLLHWAFHQHKTKEPWQCQARILHCSAVNSLIAGSSSEWWISEERGYLFLSLLRNRKNRGSFPGVQCIRINTVKLGRCLERWLATCAIKITSEAPVSPRYISKAVCWPRLCQKSVVALHYV